MKQELTADPSLSPSPECGTGPLPHANKVADIVSLLRGGIARIDTASASCPIRRPGGQYVAKCPKCRAGPNDNCGPEVCALGELETLVRAILAGGVKLPETVETPSVDSQSPSPAQPNGLAPNPSGHPL